MNFPFLDSIYIVLAISFITTTGIAQPTPGNSYRLADKQDSLVSIEQADNNTTWQGQIVLKTDLNNDGKEDYILSMVGACGNWGHCLYMVFVQESNSLYRNVWAEYWLRAEVLNNEFTVVNGQQWNKIRLSDRPEPYGLSTDQVPLILLEYRDNRYQEIPAGIGIYNASTGTAFPDVFHVYTALNAGENSYEIGRMEAENFDILCPSDTCYYAPPNTDRKSVHSGYTKAPAILRMKSGQAVYDYTLPIYQDIDRVSILQPNETKETLLIKSRYRVFLFHPDSLHISKAIIPGKDVEYRQDAISGIMGGLQYSGKFVTGNAVNYGLFCMDVSDWKHPKELRRVSSEWQNNGQPYLFVRQKANGLWDGFAAASDTSSRSHTINRHYAKTTSLDTVFANMRLTRGSLKDPLVEQVKKLELEDQSGQTKILNVRTMKWE